LIKVEAKNPIKTPIDDLIDFFKSLLNNNSPINAPSIGPIIIPKGIGVIMPIKRPIDAPKIPYLVAPKYFDPYIGIRLSRTKIIKAIINVIINNVLSISTVLIKLRLNKPNQDVRGPGIIGIKLPIIPEIISIADNISRKRSIDIIRKIY